MLQKTETGTIAVSIRNLSVSYSDEAGGLAVVQDLSLDVHRNECLALVGPSGAGKSTLINVIAGFLPASGGAVLVNGVPVSGPGPDRGVVFQTHSLFPWKRVADNVAFGPRVLGVAAPARAHLVADLLAAVGMTEFAHFYPEQLSVGMRQRVAIARAYANDPSILLMDEPFASLDSYTAGEMQQLLWSIRQRHPKTIIFVTHNIEEAVTVADRIAVLSPRPASIRQVLEVGLSQPRSLGVETAPRYAELRSLISALIKT